jgi:hypothetical protein
MRHALTAIAVVVSALAVSVVPGHAAGTWCLEGGGLRGLDDCGYHSLAQCKASGGNGAAPCFPNKLLLWRELEQSRQQPAPKRRARERHD